jgi:hypothetical protein
VILACFQLLSSPDGNPLGKWECMTIFRTRLCGQVVGLLQGQLFTQRLHIVPFLLVKLKLAQRFVSSFQVSYPLYITLSPVEMAWLGQFSAQILQFWQKLCRPKSIGLSRNNGHIRQDCRGFVTQSKKWIQDNSSPADLSDACCKQ